MTPALKVIDCGLFAQGSFKLQRINRNGTRIGATIRVWCVKEPTGEVHSFISREEARAKLRELRLTSAK